MMTWAKMPSGWIESGKLGSLNWKAWGTEGIMALRTYIAIAQRIEDNNATGTVRATYDELCQATCLSRTSLAKGLRRLEEVDLVECKVRGRRSYYQLVDFDPEKGWAKLPAAPLYKHFGEIQAFRDWHCRSRTEFDALKVYLLIVSRRDRNTNATHLSHDKIYEYAKVPKPQIRRALSLLIESQLVFADHKLREFPHPGLNSPVYRGRLLR